MKRETWKKFLRVCLLSLLVFGVYAAMPSAAKEAQAATAGFKTVNGKTYYIKSNGQKAECPLANRKISDDDVLPLPPFQVVD